MRSGARRLTLLGCGATLAAMACGGAQRSPDTTEAGAGSSGGGDSGSGVFGSSSGSAAVGNDGGPCVNLQCARVDCTSQGKPPDATTVSGTVYDPAGVNPVYD